MRTGLHRPASPQRDSPSASRPPGLSGTRPPNNARSTPRVSAGHPTEGGGAQQKPRQGAGLSWSRLSDGGRPPVQRPKATAASPPHQRRAAPLVAQHAGGDARTKKPRRSGAKFLARVCPSRVKANPPTPYHSRLHSVRPQKKPRRSGAKFDHRACRCDNGKPTDTIPQPVAQRMCRRLITRFISRDVTIA